MAEDASEEDASASPSLRGGSLLVVGVVVGFRERAMHHHARTTNNPTTPISNAVTFFTSS